MRKTYKVAGHKFAVIMPDDSPGWNNMGNYEPFFVEDADDCLFRVEQMDVFPDTHDKKTISSMCSDFNQPRFDWYDWNDCWLMEVAVPESPVCFRMLVDKDNSYVRFQVIEYWNFSFNTMMKLAFSFATASLFTIQLHASVTMKDGKGYLFLGNSGTGKSTHSQLWINNLEGCSLLNDDNPVIRIGSDGVARVYGSPWSGKTPCYRNLDVPIGAMVQLCQAKQNKIKRMSAAEAYSYLYVAFTGLKYVKEMADAYHATNSQLVSIVHCYKLECLPDADAAFLCYKTVKQP